MTSSSLMYWYPFIMISFWRLSVLRLEISPLNWMISAIFLRCRSFSPTLQNTAIKGILFWNFLIYSDTFSAIFRLNGAYDLIIGLPINKFRVFSIVLHSVSINWAFCLKIFYQNFGLTLKIIVSRQTFFLGGSLDKMNNGPPGRSGWIEQKTI